MDTGRFTAFATCWLLLVLLALHIPSLLDNTASAEKKKTVLKHADTIEGGQTAPASGNPEPFRAAVGNVVFLQDGITLRCNRATEFTEGSRIVLEGSISVNDGNVEVFGENGIYFPDDEKGELSGNTRARMIRDGLVTKAKKAIVDLKANTLWLHDGAVAWHRGRQLSGDSIMVHVRELDGTKKIDEIRVHGHAFFASADTLSPDRKLFDQLSGSTMVIRIDGKSRLTGITVTSQARSLYHLYEEGRKPSGVNYSSGDIIRMFFREGKLSSVLVTGNIEGKQYPNRMRGNRAIDLPGFSWKENEIPRFGK
jgi:lipopolysaccharide export system protein LptA